MKFDMEGPLLPYYLFENQKIALRNALNQFIQRPQEFDYSIAGNFEEVLQGDHWSGFQSINFHTLEKRSIKGMVVSNSCDVDVTNHRDLPANVLFAPMMSLAKFIELHARKGVEQSRIDGKINSIRRQEITDIFYLPKHQHLDEEYVVLFQHIQTMPLTAFTSSKERTLEFSLSMIGFYVFLTKLSFHFCRFHEEVKRN